MAYILSEAFQTPADFMESVPGIEANTTFAELNASAVSAKKDMVNVLTKDIWANAIKAPDQLPLLQVAWANLTMYKHVIFTVMKVRVNSDKQIYKPEREEMRRQYLDNYYNAFDSLIAALSATDEWKETTYFKQQDKLPVKTIEAFEACYPIDNSYLFFYRTMALQRMALMDGFSQSLDMVKDKEDYADQMNLAFVLYVISLATAQFDPIYLPPTIRDMVSDINVSSGSIDKEAKTRDFAVSLAKKSSDIVRSIELALSTPTADSFASEGDFQQRGDKHFLMS